MPDDVIRDDNPRNPERFGARIMEAVQEISWGAVWAGVMIALGMEALFTVFGLFIGFGMYNWKAADPWAGISAWTTAWYLVTAGWSMFFGAWCAARLSGNPSRQDAILHGVTTWGLAATATILIATVASWSVLNEGIDMMRTATIATAAAGPAAAIQPATAPIAHAAQATGNAVQQVQANAGPVAQATANIISGIALRVWGGLLLGFVTALFGGWLGRTHELAIGSLKGVPPGQTRLAA